MRWSGYILAALGLAGTIYLLLDIGFDQVLHLFALAGWGVLLIIPFHVLALGLDALGWQVLLRRLQSYNSNRFLLWVACVREAISRLLPLASIGGELIGCRMIIQRGVNGIAAVASIAVELWVSVIARYLMTVIAIVILVAAAGAGEIAKGLGIALLGVLPAMVGAALLLGRARLFERLSHLVVRLFGERSFLPDIDSATRLDQKVRQLLSEPKTLLLATAWQFAGLVLTSVELLLASYLIGRPITLAEAIALEGLTEGVRQIAFFVPAGLGIQEAGFVFFGQLLGLDAQTAIALSLTRRVRDLGLGIPMLLTWQWHELRMARQQA